MLFELFFDIESELVRTTKKMANLDFYDTIGLEIAYLQMNMSICFLASETRKEYYLKWFKGALSVSVRSNKSN